MPLYNKATSLSLPPSRGGDSDQKTQQHPLKRKQPVSFDETVTHNNKNDGMLNKDLSKNRLIRSNDLNPLIQSSTETILDMLKAYAGIKECSDETQIHLNMVMYTHARLVLLDNLIVAPFFNIDFVGALFSCQGNKM
jgi:hypothetical protein